jgi:PAS domain-containing protein
MPAGIPVGTLAIGKAGATNAGLLAAAIVGGKHPSALGQPAAVVWSEIWDDIGPMLTTAMGGVEGTYVEAQLLIMERNGYPEETYYTFSYSPIPGDDGVPAGLICANSDETQRVIGERALNA